MNNYPELAYCTIPETVETAAGTAEVVYGFEFRNGMYNMGSFLRVGDGLQGIAPVNVVMAIEKGIAWLDQFQAPTADDLAYFDSL